MSKRTTKELYFFREYLKNLPKDTDMKVFCKRFADKSYDLYEHGKLFGAKLAILKIKYPEYFI